MGRCGHGCRVSTHSSDADDSRLRQELGQRGREFVEEHYAKPRILGHLVDRLDAIVAAK